MTPRARLRGVVLSVDDMDAECSFYEELFGTRATFRDGDRWAAFDVNGVSVGLAGAEERLPGRMALSVKVLDVDASVDRAVRVGATVAVPAADGPHERRAVVRDPGGRVIVFYCSIPTEEGS